jgi:chromosome partitioning protein
MRTVAIVNQKGGCGKTTVSINLASALADLGKRVLLVDMDPQSHCAVGLAVPEEQIEQSIYDVLISRSRGEPMRLTEILWQIGERLELAPASIDLSAFEQQMTGIAERECCLKNVLGDVDGEYDFVVVDCPPAVSLLTFNALRSATDVVVPVETGYFALHGLSKQLETLSILCKRCQQDVSVRVLASMYDIRTKMAREILAELRSHFADRMFKTVVNFNTRIKEAASFGQPISEYDPASKGQQDFRSLAQEVIGASEHPQVKSKRLVDSLADQLESIGASANDLLKSAKPAVVAEPPKRVEPIPVTTTAQPIKVVPAPIPVTPVAAPAPVRTPVASPAAPVTVGTASTPVTPSPAPAPRPATPMLIPIQASAAPAAAPKPVAPVTPVAPSPSMPAMNVTSAAPVTPARPVTPVTPIAAATPTIPLIPIPATPAPDPTVEPMAQAVRPALTIDEKLSDYYGVNQIQDAMVFVTLYPRAKSVQIAGDFNNWQPATTAMERVGDSGVWQVKMKLPHGTYRYRLVVDGQWQQDPYNERTELNPYGEYNSIVDVR